MIDRRYEDFWWAARLWRTKNDQASYQALLTMRNTKHLPNMITNRIAAIEYEHNRNKSLGSSSVA